MTALEAIAAGKHAVGKSQAKSKPKGRNGGTGNSGAMAEPTAIAEECAKVSLKRPAASTKMLLGCPKCRGRTGGCTQCRDLSYTGKRYQKG